MAFVTPALTLLSFHSKTRQGHHQKSQRYDGGVELPELLECTVLLLPAYFPDYAAEENLQNMWSPLLSDQGHKGGPNSNRKTGQMTKSHQNLRGDRKDGQRTQKWNEVLFFILDGDSQLSRNPTAWSEAEDQGHLFSSQGCPLHLPVERVELPQVSIMLFDDTFAKIDFKNDLHPKHDEGLQLFWFFFCSSNKHRIVSPTQLLLFCRTT